MIKATRSTDPNTAKINQLRLKKNLSKVELKELSKLKIERSARLATNTKLFKGTNDLVNSTKLQARKVKAINVVKDRNYKNEKAKEIDNKEFLVEANKKKALDRRELTEKVIRERKETDKAAKEKEIEHKKDLSAAIKSTKIN